jgi:hypothetical protein
MEKDNVSVPGVFDDPASASQTVRDTPSGSKMAFSRTSILSRRGAKRPNIVGASRTLAAHRNSFKSGVAKPQPVNISAAKQQTKQFFTQWNNFQRKNWGKGWSRIEMRQRYKVIPSLWSPKTFLSDTFPIQQYPFLFPLFF